MSRRSRRWRAARTTAAVVLGLWLVLAVSILVAAVRADAAPTVQQVGTPPSDLGCPSVPLVNTACRATTDPLGAATDAGASLGGGLAADAAKGVFDALTTWMVDAAKDVVARVGAAIDHSTRPDVAGSWFQPSYRRMLAVGAALMTPLLLLAVVQALLHQDLAALGRAVFVKLPLAALGMAVATQVVALLIALTDQLSDWVGAGMGGDGGSFAKGLADAFAAVAGGGGALVFVLALLVTVIAVVLWIELVVRQAAVVVTTLFLPLAFAGLVWPAAGHWLRRLAQGLVAFILSKLVITAVIGLAAAGLADGGEDFSKVILGLALLALATFAPYVLFRVIPVAELGTVTAVEGLRSRSVQAAGKGADQVSSLTEMLGQRSSSRTTDATTPLPATFAGGAADAATASGSTTLAAAYGARLAHATAASARDGAMALKPDPLRTADDPHATVDHADGRAGP
ncbi:MAG: hypothetical protein JOZ04_10700 [Acidimicrobiia bacterium]|nr:hypothetical protein [Acidimicrobiia bacterium]